MTIEEILRDAFDRIQSEHRVAVDYVSYQTVDASREDSHGFVITSIDFSGVALRK